MSTEILVRFREDSYQTPLTGAWSCTNDLIIEEMCATEWGPMERAEYLRKKLHKAIVAKIKREGWSQSEAGRLCGTSRIHMNHLVNGKGWAALPKMIQVADGLGLRIDLIIEDPSGKEK